MALLNFEIEGDKVISRNFRILAVGIKSLLPEFRKVWQTVITGAKGNFDKQGSATAKWKGLSQETLRARKKRQGYYKKSSVGGIRQALVWTWKTKNSFISQNGPMHSLVTNNAPYFAFHQAKTWRNPNLPRRVMLDMSQTTKLAVTNIIAKGINKRIWNFNKQT